MRTGEAGTTLVRTADPTNLRTSTSKLSMPEMPHAGKHHCQPVFVAGGHGIRVAH
jgi:hypothetical protein